jgi:hypothetical protein
MQFANYEGLKFSALKKVEQEKDANFRELKTSRGDGILYEVPVYTREGFCHSNGPRRIGQASTPLNAALKEGASAGAAPPEGFLFDSTKSYYLWLKLEDGVLVAKTVNYQTLRSAVEQHFKKN